VFLEFSAGIYYTGCVCRIFCRYFLHAQNFLQVFTAKGCARVSKMDSLQCSRDGYFVRKPKTTDEYNIISSKYKRKFAERHGHCIYSFEGLKGTATEMIFLLP
jgi:hypothetical protein